MGIKAPKHFDPKRDKNFETWLERTEFHLAVNHCQEEDKTSSLLLLLDVDSFEAATHLGIKADTNFEEAKQKLKDYFSVTETKEELVEKLDLRTQEAGESIEAFARDIKHIGHRAYPKGDPQMLEKILIKVFINGLRDEKSRERCLLHKPKTLTEAAQYARFSEAVVRVAHGRGNGNPVSALSFANRNQRGFRGRGGFSGNNRGRGGFQNLHNRGGGPFRWTERSGQRGQLSPSIFRNPSSYWKTSRGPQYARGPRCYTCGRFGHIAKDCRIGKQQFNRYSGPSNRGRGFHSTSTVATRRYAYTANGDGAAASTTARPVSCISSIRPIKTPESPFTNIRKLSAVPGKINNYYVPQLLVDSGSPVTIIRSDLWEQTRDPMAAVEEEVENFQGVTRDGLQIVGVTKLKFSIGGLRVTHPVLIAKEIAHSFILGNDFMNLHKCDIINSEGVIVFGGKRVPFTLFRSTVNLICPIICTVATTIGPYEEAVIPAMLEASCNYLKGECLLLEPRNDGQLAPLVGARTLISYTSPVVPMLIANLSSRPITITKNKLLANESPVLPVGVATVLR